eukprot:gene57681-79036_t
MALAGKHAARRRATADGRQAREFNPSHAANRRHDTEDTRMAARDYDLPKNAANHAQLSPLSFLARSADIYPDRLAVVHGARRYSWGEARQE